MISSTGAGSCLNLSGMTELDDGVSIRFNSSHDYSYWHKIIAENGGLIDLSGVTTIVGPSSNDSLFIEADSAGTISLDGLTAVSHAGGTGQIQCWVDDADMVLPSLISVHDATFHAVNGGTIDAKNQAWTYSATGLNENATNYTLMSSTGAGSCLNLSGMTELDDSVSIRYSSSSDRSYWHKIIAENGGLIDLSGVKTIVGPSSNDSLFIEADSAGTISLDGLTAVSHAGGAGQIQCWVDDADMVLPSLISVHDTTFHAVNGGTIDVRNQSWTCVTTGLNENATNYTLMSSTGAGSCLNLSGMTELDDSVSIRYSSSSDRSYWHRIIAENGGLIDLSGVKTIVGPSSDDSLYIDASDDSSIDLSSLREITGSTGDVHFRVDGGSVLCLGSVAASVSTSITLSDPNDILYAGGPDLGMTILGSKVAISNPGRGSIVFGGDFSYTHTDETRIPFNQSYVFLDGNGPQELEVGGLDVGLLVQAIRKDGDGNPDQLQLWADDSRSGRAKRVRWCGILG